MFAGAITELAFARDRFAHGGGTRELFDRHTELVSVVLGLVRPPVPGGPAPLAPDVSPGHPMLATARPAPTPVGDAYWNPIPGPP
jgi:hypothetical protein